MRYALWLALVSGCSYEHGILPGGARDAAAAGDASTALDAASDRDASQVTADASVDAPIDAHTCPPDFMTLSGGQPTSRYKRYSYQQNAGNAVTFAQASQICTNAGGYLAIPNDSDELEALDGISQNPYERGYWVGITDQDQEGVWRTVLGDLATYLPWNVGQPNGGLAANCVAGYEERLYDVDCNIGYVFWCECTL